MWFRVKEMLRWEFIKERFKEKKLENTFSTKKKSKKKEKHETKKNTISTMLSTNQSTLIFSFINAHFCISVKLVLVSIQSNKEHVKKVSRYLISILQPYIIYDRNHVSNFR